MSRAPIAEEGIIQLLRSNHLLSAVDLLEKMASHNTPVNKTTIYRALDRLLAKGLICRHSLGSDTLYYELREVHHDHAVCEQCGTVSPIACSDTIKPSKYENGFVPTHHHLTVFGICQSCNAIA